MSGNKVLFSFSLVLLIITIGELSYFFFFNNINSNSMNKSSKKIISSQRDDEYVQLTPALLFSKCDKTVKDGYLASNVCKHTIINEVNEVDFNPGEIDGFKYVAKVTVRNQRENKNNAPISYESTYYIDEFTLKRAKVYLSRGDTLTQGSINDLNTVEKVTVQVKTSSVSKLTDFVFTKVL